MKVENKYVLATVAFCCVLVYFYAQRTNVSQHNNATYVSYANQISQGADMGGLRKNIYCNSNGVELGPGSELERMIANDSEVMLFAVYDSNDQCTYAYTIPKEKLPDVGNLSLEAGVECDKIDLRRIVSNCRDYIVQESQKAGNTNVIRLASVEISASIYAASRIWYARVNFVVEGPQGVEPLPDGLPTIGVFATLDGEVVKPRRTEYTRYLDKERSRFIKSPGKVL